MKTKTSDPKSKNQKPAPKRNEATRKGKTSDRDLNEDDQQQITNEDDQRKITNSENEDDLADESNNDSSAHADIDEEKDEQERIRRAEEALREDVLQNEE